jgi:hypothetical protein
LLTAADSEWLKAHLPAVIAVLTIPQMIKAGFVFGASPGDAVNDRDARKHLRPRVSEL